jgi:hypothetical protein
MNYAQAQAAVRADPEVIAKEVEVHAAQQAYAQKMTELHTMIVTKIKALAVQAGVAK